MDDRKIPFRRSHREQPWQERPPRSYLKPVSPGGKRSNKGFQGKKVASLLFSFRFKGGNMAHKYSFCSTYSLDLISQFPQFYI
jgi:hypothetical protein